MDVKRMDAINIFCTIYAEFVYTTILGGHYKLVI